MKWFAGALAGLGVMLAAQVASATIVVRTDVSGNPAACGENQGGNTLNIGTPNATVSVGDVLVLLLSGIGANSPSNVLTSVSQPAGISGWNSARAISAIYDPNGGGRSYVLIAKVTAAFTNGVGITVTASAGSNFVGACLMDVGGLNGVFDQQAGVEIVNDAIPVDPAPTLYNGTANELALAVSSCQTTLDLTTPIDPPWTSIGVNGVGGCPAGFLITSSVGPRGAVLRQSALGTSAVGTVLIR